jgi:hypothetical protein
MLHDKRAIIAANNNADLYQAMFASHALRFERTPYAFVGHDGPPPYYSNLTVLVPGCSTQVTSHLRHLAREFSGSIGLKDSFCDLELRTYGFDVLFDASWIWHANAASTVATDWIVVRSSRDLEKWEEAWKLSGSPTEVRMFRDAMLQRPEIFFLGKSNGESFEAGCIANVSSGCIGISNVFSISGGSDTFQEATDSVASISRGFPIVGYMSSGGLDVARRAGYEATGDLRILMAKNARF